MTGKSLYWKKHKVTGCTTDTIYSAWNNEEELLYISDGEVIQVFVADFTIDIVDMLNNCKPLLTIELPNNFNIVEDEEDQEQERQSNKWKLEKHPYQAIGEKWHYSNS